VKYKALFFCRIRLKAKSNGYLLFTGGGGFFSGGGPSMFAMKLIISATRLSRISPETKIIRICGNRQIRCAQTPHLKLQKEINLSQ
jgi:hypothetical protein